MVTEKRKRYLSRMGFFCLILALLTGIAVSYRCMTEYTKFGYQRRKLFSSSGIITAKDGTELYHDGEVADSFIYGDLVGSTLPGYVLEYGTNNLILDYGGELQADYDPLTGLVGIRNKKGGLISTTLLPPEAQYRLYEAYQGASGAVFAYNYRTGEILSCLSVRGAEGNSGKDSNMVLNELYSPGSCMKILTVLCAIQQDPTLANIQADCVGEEKSFDRGEPVACSQGPHGKHLGLRDALGKSCNIFFATMAEELDVGQMKESLAQMGVKVNTDAEKLSLGELKRYGSVVQFVKTNDGHSIWTMLGQGESRMSLIDLARVAGAVNAHGRAAQPYLVDIIVQQDTGKTLFRAETVLDQLVTEEAADSLAAVWTDAVNSFYRNRPAHNLVPEILFAKTGTAETGQKLNSFLIGVTGDVAFAIVLLDYHPGGNSAIEIANELAEVLYSYGSALEVSE